MRLTNTDKSTWQYNLWRLDVLDGRNTALEHHVDVHHMALADRSNMSTRSITLLVIILINYSDDLFLREVEDIRESAYVQRTCLRRSNTVYAEVRLPVSQAIVVFAGNDYTHRNFTVYSVRTTICCANARDTRYCNTFCILTNSIALTTVVVGIVLLPFGKGQCGDIFLV